MMREEQKDLWSTDFDGWWRGILVNGDVNRFGQAIMGRGCALEAAQRFPWLASRFGARLASSSLSVWLVLEEKLFLFPTKVHSYDSQASLSLIRRSCQEARSLFESTECRLVLPRPGCGYGHLDWEVVKLVLEEEFKGLRNELVVVWK